MSIVEIPTERKTKLDELSKELRKELIQRLAKAQNGLCYVCREIIDLHVHQVDIDHIHALARGGQDDESNWGLTHQRCNRSKGARDLQLQRILSAFRNHVDEYTGAKSSNGGGNFTLHEALLKLQSARQDVGVQLCGNQITLSWTSNG